MSVHWQLAFVIESIMQQWRARCCGNPQVTMWHPALFASNRLIAEIIYQSNWSRCWLRAIVDNRCASLPWLEFSLPSPAKSRPFTNGSLINVWIYCLQRWQMEIYRRNVSTQIIESQISIKWRVPLNFMMNWARAFNWEISMGKMCNFTVNGVPCEFISWWLRFQAG